MISKEIPQHFNFMQMYTFHLLKNNIAAHQTFSFGHCYLIFVAKYLIHLKSFKNLKIKEIFFTKINL